MLRLGFVAQLVMDWDQTLAEAARMDLDYVELMMDGDTDRTALAEMNEEVRASAADHDLDLLVHLPFALDIGSPYEHLREGACREIEAALDAAGSIGAKKAVLHASSDAFPPAWDREVVQEHIHDSVRRLDAYGTEQGVEVCVENIPEGWLTLDEFPAVFERTDASMTLDTGHAYVDGYDSTAQREFVAEHADRISHVHVNDTRKAADEHLPTGAGFLEFDTILEPLDEATVSVEVFTPSYDYVEMSVETLREALNGV